MRVVVKASKLIKGVNNGNNYCFSSVLVVKDDGVHADYVNVDESVCAPSKIKPGVIAEMYVSSMNSKQVTVFDIKKNVNAEDVGPSVAVDVSTGEVIEENPPLPEPPADYPGGNSKNKK